ncbi:MAG: hypothetical protein WCC60_18545 [Ilumatobacteraceae bacterium]
MTLMIELEAGDAWMTVHPDEGGRIGALEVGEQALLNDDPSAAPFTWGCYPMVPWAGRVRRGRFTFDERSYQLPINMPPHAIHGTGFVSRWEVLDAGRDYCDMATDLQWPFGGRATQHLQLDEHGLAAVLSVYATAHAMPAVVGWHPCFRKPETVELAFGRMYPRDDDYMPLPELVAAGPPPWDDCFVEPLGPLRLHFPTLTVTIDSDCDHWVAYDMPVHITCVEPQSGPPDAFNIGGATRLEPGDLLQRHMSIRWAARRDRT